MKRWLIAGAVAYALIGVVTFGHAAASTERRDAAEYAACEQRRPKDTVCLRFSERSPISGLAAAFVWPLYWSWEAWS